MKPNKTAFFIFMIATTVVAVGFLIADILIRHNWLAALCLVLYDCIVLVPGAILLLKPEMNRQAILGEALPSRTSLLLEDNMCTMWATPTTTLWRAGMAAP